MNLADSKKRFARYGLELFVVFVGVYAAVWLENYFDEQEQAAQTEKVVAMLREDLEDHARMGSLVVSAVSAGLEAWSGERQAGARPVPFVFRIERRETPPVFA